MTRRSKTASFVVILLVCAVGYGIKYWTSHQGGAFPGAAQQGPLAGAPAGVDDAVIADAYRNRRSGLMVEAVGVVERLLADDDEGSRHQRFVVRLPDGSTVLVTHNLDLAPRVPIVENADIHFRGQYEWNDRGGVIHWTHHDPDGRHPEGWIRFRGQVYQ